MALCWRRLDNKQKKLTFNFVIVDMASNKVAGKEVVDILQQDILEIQERLMTVSRYVYMQQDLEKVHFECKTNSFLGTFV